MSLLGSLGAFRPDSDARFTAPLAPAAPVVRSPKTKHDMVGYSTTLIVMAFMRWAIERDHFPTPEEVRSRFGVCRATAYRWTSALAETYGVDPEGRHKRHLP